MKEKNSLDHSIGSFSRRRLRFISFLSRAKMLLGDFGSYFFTFLLFLFFHRFCKFVFTFISNSEEQSFFDNPRITFAYFGIVFFLIFFFNEDCLKFTNFFFTTKISFLDLKYIFKNKYFFPKTDLSENKRLKISDIENVEVISEQNSNICYITGVLKCFYENGNDNVDYNIYFRSSFPDSFLREIFLNIDENISSSLLTKKVNFRFIKSFVFFKSFKGLFTLFSGFFLFVSFMTNKDFSNVVKDFFTSIGKPSVFKIIEPKNLEKFCKEKRVVSDKMTEDLWNEFEEQEFSKYVGEPILTDDVRKISEYLRKGIVPDKGFILFGPPGTGKTLLASAFCNCYSQPYILVNGAELNPGLIKGAVTDASTNLLIKAYDRAANLAKALNKNKARGRDRAVVLLIDELDKMSTLSIEAPKRRGGEEILSILSGPDGTENEKYKYVYLVATVNNKYWASKALTRSGRISNLFEVSQPSKQTSLEIFRSKIKRLPIFGRTEINDLNREKIISEFIEEIIVRISEMMRLIDLTILNYNPIFLPKGSHLDTWGLDSNLKKQIETFLQQNCFSMAREIREEQVEKYETNSLVINGSDIEEMITSSYESLASDYSSSTNFGGLNVKSMLAEEGLDWNDLIVKKDVLSKSLCKHYRNILILCFWKFVKKNYLASFILRRCNNSRELAQLIIEDYFKKMFFGAIDLSTQKFLELYDIFIKEEMN